jgi:hypothetical protein
MTWSDIIIILLASLLAMEMKRLEKQMSYNCPHYCATAHLHYCPATKGAGLDYSSSFLEECIDRH